MNIFVLDKDPEKAAKMHCDKHCVKMIIESAQMLSQAHHYWNSKYKDFVYKGAYKNHPCTKWVCDNGDNYNWLFQLFKFLIKEYELRYGKRHRCSDLLFYLEYNPHYLSRIQHENGHFDCCTPFAQAMPEKYKNIDPIKAYRDYYNGEKAGFAKWKMGNEPEWFIRTSK